MPKISSKNLRSGLYFALGLVFCSVAVVAVVYVDRDAGLRRERIDTLYPGPYLVGRFVDHQVQYFGLKNVARGLVPDIREIWSPDVAMAHRYGAQDSALAHAQRVGGFPIRLREVVP